MLSSIVSAATEYCPEMKILPVSIPETGLSTDEDIKRQWRQSKAVDIVMYSSSVLVRH